MAHTVVFLAGVYLGGLGLLAITRPSKARVFLQAVASASTHYFELAVRLAVGFAFVMRAPYMMLSEVFSLFGWALVVTSAGSFSCHGDGISASRDKWSRAQPAILG